MDGQTDRQIDRSTDTVRRQIGSTGRYSDGPMDRAREREIDRTDEEIRL